MIAPDTTASRPFPLVDNAAHRLGQTDMVFVNAVGTGYSQAIAPLTKRSCWGVDADAALFRDFSWATRPMAGIPAMRVVRCPGTLPDLSVERRAGAAARPLGAADNACPMTPPTQLLTPRMAGVLDRIHRAKRAPFHTLTPREARIAYRMGAEILDLPRAPLARVEDLQAAGRPARLYAPSAERLPVLLYLHGGGFTIGDLETHDSLCRQLALRSGAAVLALDYRLAPEHRFPAAVDDAWAALAWLHQQAGSLGLDGSRLAVGGDSAGGTLAATTAFFARDHGLPLALQLLITPGTGSSPNTASHRFFANGFLLDAASITWFFDHYIDRSQRHDWRFAPLEADDHGGLAPACVVLAECDPLVDEGIAYADTLRAAGVQVQLELYRGVTHDFIKMGRQVPEALTALNACAEALKNHLQP